MIRQLTLNMFLRSNREWRGSKIKEFKDIPYSIHICTIKSRWVIERYYLKNDHFIYHRHSLDPTFTEILMYRPTY